MKPYQYYFNKDFNFLLNEELEMNSNLYLAKRRANYRLRMYANLFNRSIRKMLIKEDSCCVKCRSNTELTLDHITPISKGGLNLVSNIQVLCRRCNRLKSNKNET